MVPIMPFNKSSSPCHLPWMDEPARFRLPYPPCVWSVGKRGYPKVRNTRSTYKLFAGATLAIRTCVPAFRPDVAFTPSTVVGTDTGTNRATRTRRQFGFRNQHPCETTRGTEACTRGRAAAVLARKRATTPAARELRCLGAAQLHKPTAPVSGNCTFSL
jgi:hypothetical protein